MELITQMDTKGLMLDSTLHIMCYLFLIVYQGNKSLNLKRNNFLICTDF